MDARRVRKEGGRAEESDWVRRAAGGGDEWSGRLVITTAYGLPDI